MRRKNECHDCGRHRYCERARHIENYKLNSGCNDFITEATYDVMFDKGVHVIHTVPTYNEFANIFADMPAEQEWELIKLWENYVDKAKQSWSSRYTYCTGCFKDVRRDNTYTELTKDGKLLIKCKSCNTIWYVKDAE